MLEDPCNFFGVVGAGCRGAEETLFGVYKGASSVLGHPCQTEENIADLLDKGILRKVEN